MRKINFKETNVKIDETFHRKSGLTSQFMLTSYLCNILN